MEKVTRALRILAVFCLANYLLLAGWIWQIGGLPAGLMLAALLLFFLWFNIRPRWAKGAPRRLRVLQGGYELLLTAFWVIPLSMALWAVLWRTGALTPEQWAPAPAWVPLFINLLCFVPCVVVLLVNGFFRVLVTCKRLRIVWRFLLLTCWWVPVFQLFLFHHALRCARSEYYFEIARLESEAVHAENADCQTRYPLVLVHGIFFRDWQSINYWGRIPQALEKCGAEIYYGGQQSAAPVAASAAELKDSIERILAETGAEKVNIIAHSKGGLDSRYAISRLGLADRVASLTTINTPHRGCVFAGHLLKTLPKGVIGQMERKYNTLFHWLGDQNPDFLGGVRDLTDEVCRAFNRAVPDADGVLYQSVMSTMKSARSAPFPLNLTWHLVNRYDREPNDGLVARSSAEWGHFLGNLTVGGRRGISHGDVVDLMREDLDGFEVREFYIRLVKDLKEKGL